jgi:hypothetical protein
MANNALVIDGCLAAPRASYSAVQREQPAARKVGTVRGYLSAVLLVAGLGGCSSGDHMATAEEGIAHFRRLMETQQFARVYTTGSDELRKSTSEADMSKLLAALNKKLGRVKVAEKSGWKVNFHTSGTFVTVAFKTEFEKGPGTEQFVFRISNGKASLVSYNVNSPVLTN